MPTDLALRGAAAGARAPQWVLRSRELGLLVCGLLGYRAAAVLATPFAAAALGPSVFAELAVVEAGCGLAQLALGGFVTAHQNAVVARGDAVRARAYAATAGVLAIAGVVVVVPVALLAGVPWPLAAAANATSLGLTVLWVLRAQRRLVLFAVLTGAQTVVAGALLAVAVGVGSPGLWLLAQPLSVLAVLPVAWAAGSGPVHPRRALAARALPSLPFELAVLGQLNLPVLLAGGLLGAGAVTAALGVAVKGQLVLWAGVALAAQVVGPRLAAGVLAPHTPPRWWLLVGLGAVVAGLAVEPWAGVPVALLVAGLAGQSGVAVVDAPARQSLLAASPTSAAVSQVVGTAVLAGLLVLGLPPVGLAAVGPAVVLGELATSVAVRLLAGGR